MAESIDNWPRRRPIVAVAPRTEDKATHRDGVTVYAQLPLFDAIREAGGIPVMLPGPCGPGSLARMIEAFDAFVIPGGYDCNPTLYGEEPLPECGPISPLRDRFECALIPRVVEADKPLLTICRGTQVLNVALGGTLWQDIPSQPGSTLNPVPQPIQHTQTGDTQGLQGHEVSVYPNSLLSQVMGEAPQELHVNSLHHQSIRNVGRGLVVNAMAPDGVVEGVEMPEKPFVLGLQWHPEFLWQSDPREFAVFERLVGAATR
jgi:putative glutamine amidotransferase